MDDQQSDVSAISTQQNYLQMLEGSEYSTPHGFVSRGNVFAFVCGTLTPIVGSFPNLSLKPLPSDPTITGIALSVGISFDSSRAVSVHENNGIAFWDLNEMKLMKCYKLIRQLRSVSYGFDPLEVYGVDEKNQLFKYQIKAKISASIMEELMHRFTEKVNQVESRIKYLLIVSTEKSIYFVITTSNLVTPIYTVSHDHQPKLGITTIADCVELYIADGVNMKVYKMKTYSSVSLIRETCFEFAVSQLFFLNNNITAAILANGSVLLLRRSFQVIQRCFSSQLQQIIRKHSLIFGYKNQLMFCDKNEIVKLTFPDWKDTLRLYHEKHMWNECFSSAITIFAGTAVDYFGISKKSNVRCSQLIEIMTPIIEDSIQFADTEEILGWILTAIHTFGMISYAFIDVIQFFEQKGQLVFLFSVLFGSLGSHFVSIAPPDVLRKFITEFQKNDKIDQVESMIGQADLTPNSAKVVLELSKEYKLFSLYMKICINVYNNSINPCIFYSENGKLNEFFECIFMKEEYLILDKKLLDSLVFWLLTPIAGKFDRLNRLFVGNWSCASSMLSKILSLCPVSIGNGTTIDTAIVIDSTLRALVDEPYEKFQLIAETLFPLLVSQEQKIPGVALPFAIQWIFQGTSWSSPRIQLLKLASEQYPDVVNLVKLAPWIESAGFLPLVTDKKDHYSIIHVMVMSRDNCHLLFKYFKDHYIQLPEQTEVPDDSQIPESAQQNDAEYQRITNNNKELLEAVKSHFHIFVLTDPMYSVTLVADYMPEFHKDYVNDYSQPYCTWLYLSTMRSSKYKVMMDEDDYFRYFSMICRYEPTTVVKYLQENTNIPLDKALQVCLEQRVTDASIHIYSILGEMQKAIDLMASENEKLLINLIKSQKKIFLPSADRVAEEPLLADALANIHLALTTLEKAPNAKDLMTKMWKSVFKSFQLPIWLSQNKADASTKQAIALFFAYFIVEALGRTNIDLIFSLIRHEFKNMDNQQYRNIFSYLIGYLGYRQGLTYNVESIYMEDCRRMRLLADNIKTKGIIIEIPICEICKQPITGTGGVGMKFFECGHCFHNNSSCGRAHFCQVCKGESLNQTNDNKQKGRINRNLSAKVRKLQRVDHGLKSNYGKSTGSSLVGSAAYYQPEFRMPNLKAIELSTLTSLPQSIPINLTL